MGVPEPKFEHYTYADYLTWPGGERWEIIEGQAYDMTPAPSIDHQEIVATLISSFRQFFRGKPCRALAAPVDVRLPGDASDEATDTVVQPDVLVVCDPGKIDKRGIKGAPDLVVEILSASTSSKDLNEKLFLYEKHGVRGYLIVDPWAKSITVRYLGADGKWEHPDIYAPGDMMPVRLFDGLELDLARVFENLSTETSG